MKLLLTGSTGFIGSRLAVLLRERGWEVWEMLRYVSGGRYAYYQRANRVFADLKDSEMVRRAVDQVKPDVIINLGAESAVSFSFDHPEDVEDVNCIGTIRLMSAALEVGVKHFIHASTSEVYGRSTAFPITEDTPLGATSPYAASKIGAEEHIRVRMHTDHLPATILRPFNTYGRALVRNPHFVVERAITRALEEGKVHLHDPNPWRDFMFREDHVAAYLAVLENWDRAVGETFNVTTGQTWQIRQMAEAVARIVQSQTGRRVEVTFEERPDRPWDIPKLHGSSEKIQKALGWKPRYDLEAGLEQAVHEWRMVLSK